MGKRPIKTGVVLLLLILALGAGDPARAGTENLLENGGFELLDPGGKGVSWYKDFWRLTSYLGRFSFFVDSLRWFPEWVF